MATETMIRYEGRAQIDGGYIEERNRVFGGQSHITTLLVS